jgi:hypothetical protein
MLEKACDFPYFGALVSEGSPYFVFVIPVDFFLVGFFGLNLLVWILYEFLRKVIILCN